ncbi:MAG: DUF2088 domain-containing protein [Pirellulales bacterium]|nr:DUF2088 domain-containing protein [Pirellulales bacterium]
MDPALADRRRSRRTRRESNRWRLRRRVLPRRPDRQGRCLCRSTLSSRQGGPRRRNAGHDGAARRQVWRALTRPTGTAPLAELARGRSSARVVICDATRPVPNEILLRPHQRGHGQP